MGSIICGLPEEFLLNTHLKFMNMGFVHEFCCRKLVSFVACFWTSVFTLFGIFKGTVLRVKSEGSRQTSNFDSLEFNFNSIEREAETNQETETKVPSMGATEFEDNKEYNNLEEEKESPKFFFKFQYQTYREDYETVAPAAAPSTEIKKYDFLSGRDFNHYLEEPEVVDLTVKELYANSDEGFIENGFLAGEEHVVQQGETESVHEELPGNSADFACGEQSTGKIEADTFVNNAFDENKSALSDEHVSRDDVWFSFKKDFIASDSDSIASSHGFASHKVASTSDGLLTDKDFEDDFELEILRDIRGEKVALGEEDLELEELNLENLSTGFVADDFDEEDSDIVEELKQLLEFDKCSSGNEFSEKFSEKHFKDSNNCKTEDHEHVLKDSDKPRASSASDSEDSNGLESLWEHQDLIEQLKMELKRARAIGLPTILEEDESPKLMENLKPWKIEEKFHPEDRLCELYRSYGERMRKFDILNFQKMYAMGFLQSKDPLQSISSIKDSAQALTSLLSEKLLLCKHKKSGSDPMMNFIRDLHGDLETVYVGQMCLSWEILHWQYEKFLELWDSDNYGMRQYNEVACEFQQFQVLLQRFIEHEPFDGPRVQNYVQKRCIMGNLLQVPVIREDSIKNKNPRRKGKASDAITGAMLVEIIEESIRLFWRFVRADKDAHDAVQKGHKGTQIEPQDPNELELLAEVRTSLQKKEKKLKDILRSGNSILRKFRKQHQEDSSEQVLCFFTQVDMKLVSRVLNMSKLTADQLLWCHHKLSKIDFVSRKKIHVEPSFLLFPC